jgi:hypothetical protein
MNGLFLSNEARLRKPVKDSRLSTLTIVNLLLLLLILIKHTPASFDNMAAKTMNTAVF